MGKNGICHLLSMYSELLWRFFATVALKVHFTKRLQFKIVHVLTKVLHHDLLLVHVLSYAMYYLKKYTLIILTIYLSNEMFEVAQEKSCKKNCRILYEKCDKSLHIKTCFQMCTMNRRQM